MCSIVFYVGSFSRSRDWRGAKLQLAHMSSSLKMFKLLGTPVAAFFFFKFCVLLIKDGHIMKKGYSDYSRLTVPAWAPLPRISNTEALHLGV